jgi:putative salt-induced outer membrane protein YdiY
MRNHWIIKYLLIFILLMPGAVFSAQDGESDPQDVSSDTEAPAQDGDLIILKDTSGLSTEAVREKAETRDNKKEKRVEVKDVIKKLQESHPDGTVNLSEIQAMWEDLSPKADKYDWIQTDSGEWFKGEIISLYRENLEFDSDEIGIYVFDFDDVKQIKSYNVIAVNIDNAAIFQGIIRYKDNRITIIQGDQEYTFSRDAIVSMAPEGDDEFSKWSGKLTLGIDMRRGNTDQFDYTAKANLKRITSKSRLTLDYLGRYSEEDNVQTMSDNRLNEKYDVFLKNNFFWTPLFSELYQDKFTNIELQLTLGAGIGYTIFDTKDLYWDISGGPAFVKTKYYSVEDDSSRQTKSAALELSTLFEYDITKDIEFIYNYKLTLSNSDSGTFKHHMVTTLENEITDWLDFDITYVWDYLLDPEIDSEGIEPKKSDHQIMVGFGVDF